MRAPGVAILILSVLILFALYVAEIVGASVIGWQP